MADTEKTGIAVDDIVAGSGNYLKDRGYDDPAETRAKFFFSNEIAVAIEQAKISQSTAAKTAGLKQPDISQIINGNVRNFSVWRLMTTLQAFGYDINIEVMRATAGQGQVSVTSKKDVANVALG